MLSVTWRLIAVSVRQCLHRISREKDRDCDVTSWWRVMMYFSAGRWRWMCNLVFKRMFLKEEETSSTVSLNASHPFSTNTIRHRKSRRCSGVVVLSPVLSTNILLRRCNVRLYDWSWRHLSHTALYFYHYFLTGDGRMSTGLWKTNHMRSRRQIIEISFKVHVSYYDFIAAAASRTRHISSDEVHPLLRSLWWLDPMGCQCRIVRIVSRSSLKMGTNCTSLLFKRIESATFTQEKSEKNKFKHTQSSKQSKDQSKTRTSSQKHFTHRELDSTSTSISVSHDTVRPSF